MACTPQSCPAIMRPNMLLAVATKILWLLFSHGISMRITSHASRALFASVSFSQSGASPSGPSTDGSLRPSKRAGSFFERPVTSAFAFGVLGLAIVANLVKFWHIGVTLSPVLNGAKRAEI